MTARALVIGASLFALAAAGAAQAQTNTNSSEVSQTGTGNVAEIDNARVGNANNTSILVQNGRDNTTSVQQIGTLNASQAQQIGDRNIILHTEEGDINRAESYQTGDANRSAIRQRGESNNAIATQSGNRNLNQIAQGIDATSSLDFSTTGFFDAAVGVARAGNDNRATVRQVGDDLASTIRQRAASGGAAASSNVARVTQRGSGNSSTVVQESRGNSASVFQFQGGNTAATRNTTALVQRNSGATSASNPLSGNVANIAVNGQANSSTVSQNGRNNSVELTQGVGRANVVQVSQVGTDGENRVGVAQYGTSNAITIAQDSVTARADVWQQPGPGGQSSNNSVEIQQGTGTTGSAAFSAGFFNNTAPTGNQTRNLTADVTQGNGPGTASWNIAQIRQDGIDLSATIQQSGTGNPDLPNIVRIAQQGGSAGANSARAVQRAGVGPSSAGDRGSGQSGDEFFFAGGARSAEINILQSGSSNSASVEQQGRGQFARIEQGPGGGNIASILQEASATNATAIIRQSGNGNSYNLVQTQAGQYVLVSQTGNNNAVTNVTDRP
jgi:hypothetical protein